ncbi:unnamed protein product [Durusdinium trenchii]|uniref:(d)CMP kinase n=1 Tax=Durusdinium trenchii TaxID=1381693 RepID=A0ABP0JNW6_9DINO
MRWHDRELIGDRVRKEVEQELGRGPVVYQLVGQDSFEKAIHHGQSAAKGKGKGRKGIFSTSTHFLVFPRAGAAPDVQVPHQMKRRVTVVKDYADPQPLSSTSIRALAESSSLQDKVHPKLLDQVLDTYTRRRRFLLLLLGPPGSGKTSLGRELEAACGFYHISGGDVYRAAQSRASEGYKSEHRKQIVAKVMAAIVRATRLLGDAPAARGVLRRLPSRGFAGLSGEGGSPWPDHQAQLL